MPKAKPGSRPEIGLLENPISLTQAGIDIRILRIADLIHCRRRILKSWYLRGATMFNEVLSVCAGEPRIGVWGSLARSSLHGSSRIRRSKLPVSSHCERLISPPTALPCWCGRNGSKASGDMRAVPGPAAHCLRAVRRTCPHGQGSLGPRRLDGNIVCVVRVVQEGASPPAYLLNTARLPHHADAKGRPSAVCGMDANSVGSSAL
jgi:hypothetical protein